MKKQLFLLVLAVVNIKTIAQTVPAYVDTNHLTAWYSFDGNAGDSSGNGYNGTVSGAVQTTDRFVHTNNAYHLNGSSDYIGSPASFTSADSAKSLSVWFKMDTVKRGWIIGGGTDLSGQAFGLFVQTAGVGDILFQGMGIYDIVLDTLTDTTTWHNFIITYAADTINAYIDGVFKGSYPDYLNTAAGAGITIGRRQNPALESGTDAYFKGRIDDIGIWSKALDTCHVSQLYSASPHSCTSSSLNMPKVEMTTVTISPNPVYDHLTINSPVTMARIEISDYMGQKVFAQYDSGTISQVDFSGMVPGIYILRINGTIIQKIIKN